MNLYDHLPEPASEEELDDEYPIDASFDRLTEEENIRLTKQERAVLEMLLPGNAVSNTQLADVSLKYFTKISDLRKVGYDIQKVSEDSKTGIAWYQLPSPTRKLKTYELPVEVRVPGHEPFFEVFRVKAVTPVSARYRAWRMVKVIALAEPTEVFDEE